MQKKAEENMPYNGYKARVAGIEDYREAETLLKETAAWLKAKGSTQWNELAEGDIPWLKESIDRGEIYLFFMENEAAGMVMLLRDPGEWDVALWGEDQEQRSIYLHKLITSVRHKGTGLGRIILDWVSDSRCFEGRDRIRLDCIESNHVLNEFYQAAGFVYKGSSGGFCKYEKEN
ncbi:GNAT family N-acetyltransferase [Bacillus mangrovi]|uniref:GNAT family N-acetyltransferase n=1 Tax=Metabacillus mangrovi TaxID=1491830 RepID=A0A7X2S641_9BACI|nr:GNAT family N-acetyltransferase [Metabacillus mangrovi]MTH53950.1 GNAT family N-acetyltransferase [Metabacillus mangrovi]